MALFSRQQALFAYERSLFTSTPGKNFKFIILEIILKYYLCDLNNHSKILHNYFFRVMFYAELETINK